MSLLGYTGLSGSLVIEPGPVEMSVGSSSSDIRASAKLTVTGKTRAIRGDERAFFSATTVKLVARWMERTGIARKGTKRLD